MQLKIYRNAQEAGQLTLDERSVFTHKLMGEHKIVVDSIAHEPIAIQLGDYIEWRGERYYINTAPSLEKINNFTYRYVIEFEGEIYRLYNKIFMDEGQASFSYHGDPQLFLELLLTNINSIDSGWSLETVEAAPAQTLTFADESCRSSLTKIAEAFGMEFRIAGKAIYLQKSVGAETTLQFEYGRGKGLYNLQRNRIDDKNVVTRVYGFGARKNIDQDYRDGATRLVFENRYLDQNTELYGIREGSVTFEDIYPQRTGTVTAIDATERRIFNDADLNFNVNEYLLEGTVAKIVFKTGALAGYEFEIEYYRNADSEFRFNPFVEENGYTLPNDLNYPEVGDEYTLVDIKMPEAYIIDAETKLEAQTQEYLQENSVPRVMYDLNLDEKYVRERGIDLRVGNIVRVLDAQLGVNAQIRVVEVSYPLVRPDAVTAVIADSIPYTIQERLVANAVDNRTEIRDVDRERVELARRSALRFRNLQGLIFDPDGYFDPKNIKPLSIETLMLSVGAKSQNFGLIGVSIQANAEGNANTLSISGGQLAHYEIEIEGLGYVWDIDPVVFPDLDPVKPYYVYAKCSTTSLTGEWMISETPKRVDEETGKYLFNLGVLYPVKDDRRDFDFTNGMTFVNGDTITTGRIKSLDGLNFFDLSEGKFKIGNEDSSLDFNVTEKGKLTLKGVLVSSMILADNAAIENLTVRNLRTRDEGRRVEITEATNAVTLFDKDGNYVTTLDDQVDENFVQQRLAGLKARNPDNERQSTVTGNGMRTDGSGIYIDAPGASGRASIYAKYTGNKNGDSAAIAAYAPTGTGLAGLFIGGLKIIGANGLYLSSSMHYNTRRISSSVTLTSRDHFVSCYNTQTITVYLPRNPEEGRHIEIRRINDAAIEVKSSDRQMLQAGVETTIYVGNGRGDIAHFTYDGRYWHYNYMPR
tara:strand:+ start:31620 stop:34388 length:2769 start_codon:yes stop_codon:yes gene_type:complete